jgi:hypothetical protein
MILAEGFRNGCVQYSRSHKFEGVWVSNIPLSSNQGVKGSAVLRIQLDLTEEELAKYEWKEERLTHREWLIPARVLNSEGQLEMYREDNPAEWQLLRR